LRSAVEKLITAIFVCGSVYAARGKQDKRSYHYMLETWEGDKISFIAVDACPDPGPRRPFNFFGILSQVMMTLCTVLALTVLSH